MEIEDVKFKIVLFLFHPLLLIFKDVFLHKILDISEALIYEFTQRLLVRSQRKREQYLFLSIRLTTVHYRAWVSGLLFLFSNEGFYFTREDGNSNKCGHKKNPKNL